MIGLLKRFSRDQERDKTVATPPMDGPLKPNDLLDEAASVANVKAPDNLLVYNGRVLFSSGSGLYTPAGDSSSPTLLETFPAEIVSMATAASSLAVAMADGTVAFRGCPHAGITLAELTRQEISIPTAICMPDEDTLVVCIGSSENPPSSWRRDLLTNGSSGSVWTIDLRKRTAKRLAGRLAYPAGVFQTADGRLVVAESWRHRLVSIGQDGSLKPVLSGLPGYPSRLCRADGNGGAWMAVFAPRRAMVEFILQERTFTKRMLKTVPEPFWMAPALTPAKDYREPLMGGAVKQLGILKPWAPTLSYGLLVKLDDQLQPVQSFHSRADGRRHGITSCVATDGHTYFTSRGGDCVGVLVALSHDGGFQ